MPHQGLHVLRGNHFCLHTKLRFEFGVVHFCIACRNNQRGPLRGKKGKRLGNVCLFAAQGLGRQRHRGARYIKFPHTPVKAVLAQVFLKFSAVCGVEGEVAWYGGIVQVREYNGVGIGFRTVLQHIAIVLPALPFESVKIIIFDNVH